MLSRRVAGLWRLLLRPIDAHQQGMHVRLQMDLSDMSQRLTVICCVYRGKD